MSRLHSVAANQLICRFPLLIITGFQVANLWLILIGGSLINQLAPILDNPSSIVDLIALAVPGEMHFSHCRNSWERNSLLLAGARGLH